MTDLILAFDEADSTMGMFNQGCFEYYEEYLSKNNLAHLHLRSAQLNDLAVEIHTANKASFIFVAYSHGTETGQLNSSAGVYLSPVVNHTNFKNSFVYTVSCHSGNVLGNSLIQNGCLCFLGYKNLFHYWDGYKCFPDCANHGFFLFMEKVRTKVIYQSMIDEYNKKIDELYLENSFVASLLLENRDALVHLGNDISIDDMIS